ncbi:hypothetical protein EYF80_006560 [Liparis tanakae]|uniref:Uncharacterized protein n=1 Tax=Liparis tanakae TaxID=230148 RepID=A0A4Z2IZP8_9TELE|nr:hypothetical protein EYF80_006560 [Liparis tanakae]
MFLKRSGLQLEEAERSHDSDGDVFDVSHTVSIKLKWSKPSAKPHSISVRWCFPSSTRDMPTRKAHSTSRMRSGTASTR